MGEAERGRIVIAGGGAAGLTMALAIDQLLDGTVEVVIVEPRAEGGRGNGADPGGADPRAWAISASSRRLLAAIGVWPQVTHAAEAVREIRITDSGLADGARPVRLTYENTIAAHEPASHILPAAPLEQALRQVAATRPRIVVRTGAVDRVDAKPDHIDVGLQDGAPLEAALLIGADGRSSRVRALAAIDTIGWAHDQWGIVTRIAIETPHHGIAVQHFLPGGPFALLPLPGQRFCITWSERKVVAERLMALPDQAFLAEVEQRVGGRYGRLALDGARKSFPLATHIARSTVAPRIALIGDAAHGVHPIAGQGLNLALKDVGALADCIAEAARAGLDLADGAALARFQRWRRFDSVSSALAFDGLNRLFSRDPSLLRAVRGFGLGVIDRLSPIKALLTREAAGLTGELPSLMRDELTI